MKIESVVKLNDHPYSYEDFAKVAIAIAIDKKALKPILMDLRNQGAFTEFFAIVSAVNSRQVYAIAEGIRQTFRSLGVRPVTVDGLENSTWVLLDYGFIFIHVFLESTRELYQLEQLWSKARSVSLIEEEYTAIYQELKNNLMFNNESHEINNDELLNECETSIL